jgi:hypothetical protein
MGTFPVSFHILQALHIVKNPLGGMPCLSIGVDRQACPPLPTGGGAEAATTYDILYVIASCGSVVFDGPPSEDFLQMIARSACKSTFQ